MGWGRGPEKEELNMIFSKVSHTIWTYTMHYPVSTDVTFHPANLIHVLIMSKQPIQYLLGKNEI
jgi:hypothetical protein